MEVMLVGIPFLLYIYLRIRLGVDVLPQEKDEALFKEGIDFYISEEYVKAFRYFEQVTKEYPKSATAFLYRAKCHYYFENWEAALEDFEKTLRIDNSFAEAYLQKAKCYYHLENYSLSLYELKRASRMYLDKNVEVLRLKGELEYQSGDFESAKKSFKLATKLGDEQSNFLVRTLFLGNSSNILE